MRLFHAPSGNTKRLRMFMAEKNIEIERVEVALGTDTRSKDFRTLNSLGQVPVLELDDGQILTESYAICLYLERLFPENPLMGTDAVSQGQIAMWRERMHGQLFLPYGQLVHHSAQLFADIVEQIPEFAESQRRLIPDKWTWFDQEMADGRPFIAGRAFSVADIEGMTALFIADAFDLGIPRACTEAHRWANAMRQRASWLA